MARIVHVKAREVEEDILVTYTIGIPDDVVFFKRNGILYAQWWNQNKQLIEVPAEQVISIE